MTTTMTTQPRVLSELLEYAERHLWTGTKNAPTAISNARHIVRLAGPQTQLTQQRAQFLVASLTEQLRIAGLAPATINRKLSAFSALMSLAVELGVLEAKPKIRWQKEPAGRMRYLTPIEEVQIIHTLNAIGAPEIAQLCKFLVETGLRRGEALALQWTDVLDDTVTVRESKSGKGRRVPLTSKAQSVLTMRQGLSTPFGGIKPNRLTHYWNKAVKLSGVQGDQLVPHILRHTCASRLVQRGVALPVVKEWMGHADIKTTMRYAHIGNEHLEAARDALES